MHQQLTNLSEAGPQGVDWIKLAQNRSWWWAFVDMAVKLRVLLYLGWKSWAAYRLLVFLKGNFLQATTIGLILGMGFGGG